jgi:hypothetical protein
VGADGAEIAAYAALIRQRTVSASTQAAARSCASSVAPPYAPVRRV